MLKGQEKPGCPNKPRPTYRVKPGSSELTTMSGEPPVKPPLPGPEARR
jgi:hypothetical protein